MTTTLGKTTFGRNNRNLVGALIAGVAAVGVIAGVGIWDGAKSDSTTIVEPAAVRPVDFESTFPSQSYVYLVSSATQGDAILQAHFEMLSAFPDDSGRNSTVSVIDLSTPEGQETARLMNEVLMYRSFDPTFDPNAVQIIDLTTAAVTSSAVSSVEPPVFEAARAAPLPTFYYLVDSKEQGDLIIWGDAQAELESGVALDHRTEVIDMSTAEGQAVHDALNQDLLALMLDPMADPNVIRIVDVRE